MKKGIHMFTRGGICSMLAAALALGVTGCAPKAQEAAATQTEIVVQVRKPEIGSLTQSSQFIGTVEPNEWVNVLPKMPGTVKAVHFGVGDVVKKGDILFEVDSIDVELSLAAQRAALDAAQAGVLTAQAQVDQQLGSGFDMQLAQLQTQVEAAKKQYSSARQGLRDYNDGKDDTVDDLTEMRDKTRDAIPLIQGKVDAAKADYKQVYEEKGGDDSDPLVMQKKAQIKLAEQELQKAESSLSMLNANINDADDADSQARQLRTAVSNAQLSYDSANTIYELTKGDARSDALKVANATLKQATASFEAQVKSYEAASHQLEYAVTQAPIDGVIEACNATENAMLSQTSPAFVISNKADTTAVFYVSADAVQQMSLGDKVSLESGREQFAGTLVEVGSMADPSIGLFKVKAAIENGSHLMTGLSISIFAETAKANNTLLIPQSAVHYEEGKGYVYVCKDGVSVKTIIETGVANNDMVEVVAGLTADSQLIVTWNPNLRDGVTVTVKTDEPSASAADTQSTSAADTQSASAADTQSVSAADTQSVKPDESSSASAGDTQSASAADTQSAKPDESSASAGGTQEEQPQ